MFCMLFCCMLLRCRHLLKLVIRLFRLVFFFKQKTAYELRISDWSSDVCSSDLMPVVCVIEKLSERYAVPSDHRRHVSWDSHRRRPMKIGRASCRERVCQYV